MHRILGLLGILLSFLPVAGCAKPALRDSLATMQAPEGRPQLLAIYQPWFGRKDHIDVGYTCHDPAVLRQQIAKARALNISGFVVNWYGPRKEFEDHTYGLLQQVANENNFKVAVQYDEAVDHPGYATDAVIVDLQYLYDKYISPSAGSSRE